MVLNFPGPYELRVNYIVNGMEHVHRHSLSVDGSPAPGTPFSGISGTAPDSSPVNLDAYTDNFVQVMAEFYNAAVSSIGLVELWEYTPLTFDAQFISSYNPTPPTFGGGTTFDECQLTFTFRTLEGGIFKCVLLGADVNPRTDSLLYPTGILEIDAVFDFFLDTGQSLARGRDTSRPFAALKHNPTINKTLFNKVYA